ncbi:MAG: NUDIX hydrolase [Planctomycetota bacterium]|nr:NUDIX hydrolase [Planctomycetota bacterium]
MSNRRIYRGKIFDIYRTELKDKSIRETVVHPGAVAVLPLVSSDEVVLVRQYRYPARKYLWELPAGTLKKNEPTDLCARRELQEETGFVAGKTRKIAVFYTCPGFCTEKMHLYVAEKLSRSTGQKLDPDEKITYNIFSRQEIVRLIKENKIKDAKSIIGLILWLQKKI